MASCRRCALILAAVLVAVADGERLAARPRRRPKAQGVLVTLFAGLPRSSADNIEEARRIIEGLFQKLDENSDGEIDLREFLQAAAVDPAEDHAVEKLNQYEDVFEQSDFDSSGRLCPRELEFMACLAGEGGSGRRRPRATLDEAPGPQGVGGWASSVLSRRCDIDGDGKVDEGEFTKAMRKASPNEEGSDLANRARSFFTRADVSGDGSLDSGELFYAACLSDVGAGIVEGMDADRLVSVFDVGLDERKGFGS
mmetsp:Transcript_108714/g.313924  ORF Transcript_108714/g.313924 Transcript_108714/m.313924 type:complete len:254 (+) Transcript_108714:119-880(+)